VQIFELPAFLLFLKISGFVAIPFFSENAAHITFAKKLKQILNFIGTLEASFSEVQEGQDSLKNWDVSSFGISP
jgi:hypothetical protein